MKKIRLMALLLSVTSCLMLFSVGFASWHGLVPSSASTSGSFVSYPAGLVSVDNVSLTPYSELGFYPPLETGKTGMHISDTGTFTFDVALSEACFSGPSFEVKFEIKLTYNGATATDLLPYCTASNVTVSVGGIGITTQLATKTVVKSGDTLIVTIKENGTKSGDTYTYNLYAPAEGKTTSTARVSFQLRINPTAQGATPTTSATIYNGIRYTITPMIDVQ